MSSAIVFASLKPNSVLAFSTDTTNGVSRKGNLNLKPSGFSKPDGS